MIEVTIVDENGELAKIRIERLSGDDEHEADYSVEFAVDRLGAVGVHQRGIFAFPRTKYNALALLRQALATLEPKELELEQDISPSDMAGRFRRTLPAIQGWASRLHHH